MVGFSTQYEDILEMIAQIEPRQYARSRNYLDGAVTYLSPYISRGVISTKQVYEALLERDHPFGGMEKFVQELAWRDYWQQVWIAKGNEINQDLRHTQEKVVTKDISVAFLNKSSGVEAIDEGIERLEQTGYMHNHMRMYVAAIACNMGQNHWKIPAKWMYYHLLDGDWASNALSWQWVAGSNSNKKYVANQENINNYTHSRQRKTFLDVPYADFENLPIPAALEETQKLVLVTKLPAKKAVKINPETPTLIYNYYNLDFHWHTDLEANRILLLEPSVFEQYPVGEKPLKFALDLAKEIKGIQVFVGEFSELKALGAKDFIYKEHPLNNYIGKEESREWLSNVTGYYSSFFKFWKKCKKELKSTLFG